MIERTLLDFCNLRLKKCAFESQTAGGVTVRYAYDAAGRLVREGDRMYRYGYLDKVLSVTEGKKKLTYTYHVDGQLATADLGDGRAERFAWDGLALVRRGGESFICEPHVGGGNPIVSSEGTAYLNDMLGTTVAAKSARRCSAAALTAFGESLPGAEGAFFTGKPQVEGLGYAFLYRNYRADLAKWQTADPLGYPDGWNQLAYCGNRVVDCFDFLGAVMQTVYVTTIWMNEDGGGIGTPFPDLYKFMKDTWSVGSSILGLLNINSVGDLIKAVGDALTDKVKDKVEDVLGTDQWFEEAVKAAIADGTLSLGYTRVPPTRAQIDAAVGRTDYSILSMSFIGVSSWDVDSSIAGVHFINGCSQKWKVVVAYECE